MTVQICVYSYKDLCRKLNNKSVISFTQILFIMPVLIRSRSTVYIALILQCTVRLLWLRAVRVALDLCSVQQPVVPAASLGHISIRNKQQPLLLQERCLTELLSKFHRRIQKRRKLTKRRSRHREKTNRWQA